MRARRGRIGVQAIVMIALALWAVAPEARAQAGAERALTEAASRARALGKYAFALHALRRAHELTLDEELLHAIAEVHHRRFAVERRPHDLSEAVEQYRRYLRAAPSGAHREEAKRALAELEPRLEAIDARALEAHTAQERSTTHLGVMANALGAVVRIDGRRPQKLPQFLRVKPGKHRIVVTARGYRKREQTVVVPRGSVVALMIELEPEPAKLAIAAPSGAEVHVDGKRVGSAPFSEPLAMDPGEHFVAVVATGFDPHSETVELERGEQQTLSVDLEATEQRIASWVLMGTGAAGIAGGIVLGVLSVVEHREARDILERISEAQLPTLEDRDAYEAAIAARDDYRLGSGLAAGFGLGIFLLGGVLFAIDEPELPSPPVEVGLGSGTVRLAF